MFSSRLKVILLVLCLILIGLFARAAQVQWRQHDQWSKQAKDRLETIDFVETARGRILDVKGRELAVDAPCIDAVIDYRVITRPPDAQWVREYARQRLRSRLGDDYLATPREQQRQLIEEQTAQVREDIERMWTMLGEQKRTGATAEQIEDRRQQIIRKVQLQARYLWYQSFVRAEKLQTGREPSWWQKWLTEEGNTEPDIDSYDLEIGEQSKPHVVLPAVSGELANYLGKNAERLPGLSLQPGRHRLYPYGEAACHVIGYLSPVSADDRRDDAQKADPLRRYWPSDLVGRQGVEAMSEAALRGIRGRWKKELGREAQLDVSPQPGSDVRLAIDIELQKKIETAFVSRKSKDGTVHTDPLHGAAILIDLSTGELRALASYPTYDINQIDHLYTDMALDDINRPLLNRATQAQLEPGSTVKPMVGIAGITEKVVGVHEGIECTGKLRLGSQTFAFGKCWTYKLATALAQDPAHHRIPTLAPHQGKYGNADGFLTLADALERSCNVFPETVADRLGYERLMAWFRRFGLGRRTGIGIAESAGRLPRPQRARDARSMTWFAAIGQGIGATPLQMANVAATIARDGLWMRPQLLADESDGTTASSDDRVQLPIDPRAVAEARLGMTNVVNAPAGTGKILHRDDLRIAGKTGTAQAGKLTVIERDERGNEVIEGGRKKRKTIEPGTLTNPNPQAMWYRYAGTKSDELNHAWFIGYAPAEKPRIAFAVMVEYGGGGGAVAGPIAQALLDAATEEGYLATK